MKSKLNNKALLWGLIGLLFLGLACKKYLPDDRDAITGDSQFTQKIYTPVLGRVTLMNNNFYSGGSSIPFSFKIINPRIYNDGSMAKVFFDSAAVKVWKNQYSGQETSLEEIENKRGLEYHPLFEIREHSGNFVMWPSATTANMLPQPDSGYVFDVEATNSGGRVYFRDFRLLPFRERPYEPSNYNPLTGQTGYPYLYPNFVYNVDGERSGLPIAPGGLAIAFKEPLNKKGHTLTFKFLDTLNNPIDPTLFNDTDWKNLIHGFNMRMNRALGTVTYDVAFPIPLAPLVTKYTDVSGTMARINLMYHRQGIGNLRKDAVIQFDFALFQPGDWEIHFMFRSDNPKFSND